MDWNAVTEWIQNAMSILISSGTMAIIGGVLVKHFTSKKTTDKLVKGVTDKIITRDVKVDLTAITERQLGQVNSNVDKKIGALENTIKQQSQLLKSMAVVIAKLKRVTDEERANIENAINALQEPEEAPIQINTNESVVIALEPVNTASPDNDLF